MVDTERALATLRYIIAERLCLDTFLFCVSVDVLPKVVLAAFLTSIYFYTAKSPLAHRSYTICFMLVYTWKENLLKMQEYVMSRVLDLQVHIMDLRTQLLSLLESSSLSRSLSPGQQASQLPKSHFGLGSSPVALMND